MEAFAREILSSKEMDILKQEDWISHNECDFERDKLKRQHTLVIPRDKVISQPILQKLGSFMIPKGGIERQIFQTALDVMTQSIIAPSWESDSDETD